MNVCRSCLRQQLGLARTVAKLSRSKSIPKRYAATSAYHQFVPPIKPTPWSQDPEDIEIFNSYSLVAKVEHLLRMKTPTSVLKMLNKSRLKDAVFSWNLLIKYYAKLGEWENAEKAFQQLKKTGAKPILDTHVQMAHCINTLQRLTKGETPPKVRYTLDTVKRLDDFDDWTDHKGIGIFMTIVAKACLRADTSSERNAVLPLLIQAAHRVWEKTNPFDHDTKLSEEDKERLLTHYVFALSHSTNNDDLMVAVGLFPRLLQFPSTETRRSALRIALCLNDSEMAKTYWHKFPGVPFDETSAVLYLRVLSQGFLSKDAADILDQIIANKSSQRQPRVYMLALLSCLRLPNLNTAMRIYAKVLENPRAKEDFYINELMLRIFARATQSNYSLRKHKPDYIYSILRTLDMPRLMKRKDISTRERLQLVETAQQIVSWRSNSPDTNKAEQEIVEGDLKFYKRWEAIIRNSDTPKEAKQAPIRQSSRGPPLNRGDHLTREAQRPYSRYLSIATPKEKKPKSKREDRDLRRNQDGIPHTYPPRKFAPAHLPRLDRMTSGLTTRTPPLRNTPSGVDQRRFASTQGKKKRKGPDTSKINRKVRRKVERMDSKTAKKVVAKGSKPHKVYLSHLSKDVRPPSVEKGSNVRDINSIKPRDQERFMGHDEDFTRPRTGSLSKELSLQDSKTDIRDTSNRPSSPKLVEGKTQVKVVEDSFESAVGSNPRQDWINPKLGESSPGDRQTVEVMESFVSLITTFDMERDVMSMSAEDRIRLSRRESNDDVIADEAPATIVETNERKEHLDSGTEVMSMSAEDRINAALHEVAHRNSVSKSVQFNDPPSAVEHPRIPPEADLFNEGQTEDKLKLDREVRKQNRLRLAMGRWTQNNKKGWELIRRAERIGSKKLRRQRRRLRQTA